MNDLPFAKDAEFQKEPYDVKRDAAINYFDTEMADDDFRSLPNSEQERIKNNFIFSNIGGDPNRKNTNLKVDDAYMYYDKNGIGWREDNMDSNSPRFVEMQNMLNDKQKNLEKQAQDLVKKNMTQGTIDKLEQAVKSKDNNSIVQALNDSLQSKMNFDKMILRSTARYPLGVGKATEDLWNTIVDYSQQYEGFDWMQKPNIMNKFISENEQQIRNLETQMGVDSGAIIRPSTVINMAEEFFGIGKLIKGTGAQVATEGATGTLRDVGAGNDWKTALLTNAAPASGVFVGLKTYQGIRNFMKSGEKTADDVLNYIIKNDEVYNNDQAINTALQNYYKVFKPSGNVTEDKVRALINASPLLGSEIKVGSNFIESVHSTIPMLRKQTQEIKTMIDGISSGKRNIEDVNRAIQKALKSPYYEKGMQIIKENFNADVAIDKKVWSQTKNELDSILQLQPNNPEISGLINNIQKAIDNGSVQLVDLIDWEKSLGKIAYSTSGTAGYKLSIGDKYVTKLVDDALKEQPEGRALYKSMKEIYSEASVFREAASKKQQNALTNIMSRLNDKKITPDAALSEIISLKDLGSKTFEDIYKIGGAKVAQDFEGMLVQAVIKNKTFSYEEINKAISKMGFVTENGKQLQKIMSDLNNIFKSEKIDERLRQLATNSEYQGQTITADLLAKAKYALAGNIWNKVMTFVTPSLREAKDTANILLKAGKILENQNALKSFSKIDDAALQEAFAKVTARRVEAYQTAKKTTSYEDLRVAKKEENKVKMLQAEELAKKIKAGRLGFQEGTPSTKSVSSPKKELP